MDLIRGVSVITVAAIASMNRLELWMLMIVAGIEGVCTSFFNPAVETLMPLIVSKDCLVQANSIYETIKCLSDMIGQTVGGILYKYIGAPILFLINGGSYIFSSCTEIFISDKKTKYEYKKTSFFTDIKDGIKYMFKSKGLLY